MRAICDTCSLSKGCPKPKGGVYSCRRYVSAKESNYQRLFGTPEKAAKTLEDACFYCDGKLACDDCVIGKMRGFRDTEDEVVEWLGGDAE